MLSRIVDDVAALAQSFEVAGRTVTWIMIKVCAGQHNFSSSDGPQRYPTFDCQCLPTPRAPAVVLSIPPASISKMGHPTQVRPTTMLASRAGASKSNDCRKLFPIDWVEPAVFGTDRHSDSMSQVDREQKENLV